MPTYEDVDRRSDLGYEALAAEYLDQERPVILTDLCSHWKALARWTPDFFRERYGQRLVEVYDEQFAKPGQAYLRGSDKMRFGDYIDLIENGPTDKRLFLFELFRFAPELRNDIELPHFVDVLSRQFLVSFFGGQGGVTTFHYDVDLPHVFHCVIHGAKEFYLFPSGQADRLHRHPWTVRSYINVKAPDHEAYPRFRHAKGYFCRVRAGETLVIPSLQWHQTHYPESSWGLAFRKYIPRRVPRALYNMAVQESVDKVLTRLAPDRWFAYKSRAAQ